jgi:hypothetical protein
VHNSIPTAVEKQTICTIHSSSDREEDNVQYLVPAEEEKKKN